MTKKRIKIDVKSIIKLIVLTLILVAFAEIIGDWDNFKAGLVGEKEINNGLVNDNGISIVGVVVPIVFLLLSSNWDKVKKYNR